MSCVTVSQSDGSWPLRLQHSLRAALCSSTAPVLMASQTPHAGDESCRMKLISVGAAMTWSTCSRHHPITNSTRSSSCSEHVAHLGQGISEQWAPACRQHGGRQRQL